MMKKLILLLGIFCILNTAIQAQDIYGNGRTKDTTYLDPADFNSGEYIKVDSIAGNKVFVGANVTAGNELPYYYFTQTFSQSNASQGGKIRLIGAPVFGVDTANTIADSYSHSGSAKLDVGIYKLQFVTDGGNQFRSEIRGQQWWYLWEKQTVFVWGKDIDDNDSLYGYAVFGSNFNVGDFDLDEGIIIVKTYNTSWALADDILINGVTVTIKCNKSTGF